LAERIVIPNMSSIPEKKEGAASGNDENIEVVDDDDKNLHVTIHRSFAGPGSEFDGIFDTLLEKTDWYRVKYASQRYGNECETPCWTTFYGGVSSEPPNCYLPVPSYLKPLCESVSKVLGTSFNAFLVRLYFDGKDNIAWHTDGRKFLGQRPTIASLSLGGKANFEMRRMTDCWPCVTGGNGDDGIDRSEPQRVFECKHGDLLVMRGDTQDHWHHRVPVEKGRMPRININFRYIQPKSGTVGIDGQATYYKYMVHGDSLREFQNGNLMSFKYSQLLKKNSSLLSFVSKTNDTNSNKSDKKKRSINSGNSSGGGVQGKKKKTPISTMLFRPVVTDGEEDKKNDKGQDDNVRKNEDVNWTCSACTFVNEKPIALACEVCGSERPPIDRKVAK